MDDENPKPSDSGEHLLQLKELENLGPPIETEGPAIVKIDAEKLLKAWKLNTETQRIIVQRAEDQVRDNERTRKDNARTRIEIRIGILVLALAAMWMVNEQRITRRVMAEGAEMLSRVDSNVKTLAQSNTMVGKAVAEQHVAELEMFNPAVRERALQAALEAQETAAEAEIEIARTRHEPPPKKAIETLSEARKRKRNLDAAAKPNQ